MADGSHAFNFPLPQRSQLRPGEIVVDLFAGGGGASEALKQALGIDPALAYNHDEWAIGMHAANHPLTKHHREDIWHADPARDVAGRPVGWFHASPDCTHFSQAKGGQPRNGKIRSLSWVIPKWIGQLAKVGLAPRIVSMENVWQIRTWGPLVAKRDKATGRVLKMDGTVAAKGERVPVELQQLVPDKRRTGRTWRQFLAVLESFGYVGEARKLVASDYGAGTSRERLFGVWRRDGEPVVWPAPTHGKAPGLLPLVTAADCIDFSDLGRSIFDRPRPLADATMRRIAKGIVKHVLQADEPFFLTEFANASNDRTWSAAEPLRTQCAGVKGGHFAVVAPTLVQTGYGERAGQEPRVPGLGKPLGTIVAGGVKHALVSAFLEQACSGYYTGAGQDLRRPAPTICAKGSIQRLVTADMAQLSPEAEAGALRVAAFLISYYGNGDALSLADPLDTVTTRDRMALVTVHLQGVLYVIVDIGLRMLKPAELFRAQGFPPDYIIDRTADGRRITTTAAVRMVGNSVSPPPLCALARANLDRADVPLQAAA
ncbi:DNA cytosine methyltransferase [Luteimonas notoginsengisoli]|uniref:DNA (cytosine-5-)-methyltransferase n=1 Tax=Luteimonas notoginsengisoli TaxID=1578200 RepID=A0ABV7UQJ1_9GAMM